MEKLMERPSTIYASPMAQEIVLVLIVEVFNGIQTAPSCALARLVS